MPPDFTLLCLYCLQFSKSGFVCTEKFTDKLVISYWTNDVRELFFSKEERFRWFIIWALHAMKLGPMKETPLIKVLHSFQSKPKTFALMGFLITSLSAIKRCSNPRSSQFHMAYKNYNTLLLVWTRHCWGSFWTKHRGTCKGSVHRSRTAYAEHSSSFQNPRSRYVNYLQNFGVSANRSTGRTFWSP